MARTSSRRKRHLLSGSVHIYATFNNTIVSVSDLYGDVVTSSSSGANGFKGSMKSTPYAAQVTALKAVGNAVVFGLRTVSVSVKGPGAGRESAIRAVATLVNVTEIKDVTPVPHNGCRPPKRRRV